MYEDYKFQMEKAKNMYLGAEGVKGFKDLTGDDAKSKKVEKIIRENFDLSPRGIREMLSLNKPIYECTSAYGHFGRKPGNDGSFSWEKTDKIAIFKK